MTASAPTARPARFVASTALAAGALLVFLELVRTMRSSLWIGFSLADLPAILTVWALYSASVGVVMAVPSAFLDARGLRRAVGVILPFVCAAGIWAGLAAFTRQIGWGGLCAGMLLFAAAALYLLVLTRNDSVLILRGSAALVVSCIAGVFAASTFHDRYLLQPEMRAIATPAAFLVASLMAALVALSKGRLGVLSGVAVFGAVALVRAVVSEPVHAGPAGPNVLFVTSDTLRADFCSVYGGDVPTPNMERLAEQGACFDQSYSLAPWTLPSMIGLLASTYPPSPSPERSIDERREEVGAYRFPESTATLAQLLHARGSATGAFVANTLLDDPEGFLRGFDQHIVVGHRTHVPTGFFQSTPLLQQVLRQPFPGIVRPRPVDTTKILSAYARHFIGAHSGPWFLWIHFMDPHTAYDPPDAYRTETGPWPVFCNADPYWGERSFDEQGLVQIEAEHRPYVKSLYEGEIRYIDDALGTLLNHLDAFGIRDKTYVLFTSDHGEEFWEHGQYGHGQSLHDELLHVPLILAGPDIVPQRVTTPFSAVHVVPTLADLLALPVDTSWRGASEADALRKGSSRVESPAFSQATHPSITQQPWQAVRQGAWKLIRGMQSGELLLFDVTSDPGEQHNLAASEPDKARELGQALDIWQTTFPYAFSQPATSTTGPAERQELLNRLQDLGYL